MPDQHRSIADRAKEAVVTAVAAEQVLQGLVSPFSVQPLWAPNLADPRQQAVTRQVDAGPAPAGDSVAQLVGQLADQKEREYEEQRRRGLELGYALRRPDSVEERSRQSPER